MATKSSQESSSKRKSSEKSEDATPAKKPTIGFAMKSPTLSKTYTQSKSLLKPGAMKKPLHSQVALKLSKDKTKEGSNVLKKSSKVAAIFNEDSDSEPEEIPPEAKMRMKNIGRQTPTSSGPNSFNKGKLGFCDAQRLWEKRQEEIAKQNERKKAAN